MKPLQILPPRDQRQRDSRSSTLSQEQPSRSSLVPAPPPPASAPAPASTANSASPTPTPPASRSGRKAIGHISSNAKGTSDVVTASATHAKENEATATIASQLDEMPVGACLEYLTRPHHSWDSASKVVKMRRERVAEHEASVLSRSFAFSRRSSIRSTLSVTGLMNSSFTSVTSTASAPAGFPRSSASGSGKLTGTLRRSGRLAAPGGAETPGAVSIDVKAGSVGLGGSGGVRSVGTALAPLRSRGGVSGESAGGSASSRTASRGGLRIGKKGTSANSQQQQPQRREVDLMVGGNAVRAVRAGGHTERPAATPLGTAGTGTVAKRGPGAAASKKSNTSMR